MKNYVIECVPVGKYQLYDDTDHIIVVQAESAEHALFTASCMIDAGKRMDPGIPKGWLKCKWNGINPDRSTLVAVERGENVCASCGGDIVKGTSSREYLCGGCDTKL